jgi:hypothetical protein
LNDAARAASRTAIVSASSTIAAACSPWHGSRRSGSSSHWSAASRDGKNANELTHQRLTDIGRAPSFYDCLVEVAKA